MQNLLTLPSTQDILVLMITDRQIQLLKAVISEYLTTSEPVGSVDLAEKYRLNCSAATIRNEMARLIDQGFLQMLHTSAGRTPTEMAYRYYLDELLEEIELPVLQEVALKQRLWPVRFEFERMMRQAVVALSEITKEMALATTQDGHIVHAGAVNLLDQREFWDISVAKAALHLADRPELLEQIFQKAPYGGEVRYVIGNELGYENLALCSMVFSPYISGKKNGFIAVLGPARMNYQSVIPAVRFTKKLVEELGESW